MKYIFLSAMLFFFFFSQTYALPVGVLVIGWEMFYIFFVAFFSFLTTLFFFFKGSKTGYKVGIMLLFLCLSVITYYSVGLYNIKKKGNVLKKENILKEYVNDIKSLGLHDFYYNNNIIDEQYITRQDFLLNTGRYYSIDIRENIEVANLPQDFPFIHTRFPDIIKNHNNIFQEIDQPILVTCIDGERGRIVSDFLRSQGYNSYYLKGGLNKLGVGYGERSTPIDPCIGKEGVDLYVGIDSYQKNQLYIPYLQITDADTNSIVSYFLEKGLLSDDAKIRLTCHKDKLLNCGVGRQSLGMLLQERGFKNVCLGK